MKITVNGSEYASWDDVPEDIRRTLEANPVFRDTNHDGVPDGLDAALHSNGAAGSLPFTTTTTTTSVTINGKTYDSLDQVPAHARAAIEAAGLFGNPAPSDHRSADHRSADYRSADPRAVSPVEAHPASATPTTGADRLTDGQVLLNGKPFDVDGGTAKKRWWRRG